MNIFQAAKHLACILQQPEQAYLHLNKSKLKKVSTILCKLYLPLLAIYPLAIALSPWSYMQSKFPLKHLWLAPGFACACIFFAIIYDRILENAIPKIKIKWNTQATHHVALYFHLSICSVGPFFLIHPICGYFMLFVAVIFANLCSIEYSTVARDISRARAIACWFLTLLFFMLPLALLLLIYNIMYSFSDLQNL